MKIKEIKVKSVLSPSKLPGADFVVNPYVGCSFGCIYCYAAFIGRWKHPGEEWGSFLDVKINAPEVLRRDLERLKRKKRYNDGTDKSAPLAKGLGTILFSSVTDPYLGQEAKYKITRQCLEVLSDFGYQGEVSILTKSPLATRDVDLFKKLNATVGLTVTTLEDRVSRFLEGNASPVSSRLKALKKLNDAGIDTYAFVGPLLPYFTLLRRGYGGLRPSRGFAARKDKLGELFQAIEDTGTKEIWLEHINLSPKIKKRLFDFLEREAPELIPEFEKADTQEYRDELERVIKEAFKDTNLKLALDEVIYHRKAR